MSADSPKRSAVRCVPAVVPPQVVTDRSLIDSVAGFINDVTLTSPPQVDPKEQVLWVRFENMADISDPTCGDDWEMEGNVPPPLIIILGFGSGIKVYALPAHGEAVEVLGWRHGVVKSLRILPTPISADDEMANEPIDQFVDQRPLMAICDSSSTVSTSQYCSVNFMSLKNGAQVKIIKFKNPVVDIFANRTSVVITFQERIAVFDARNLEDRLSITSCHPSPGINPNPVAIGARWMAYSEFKLLPSKRSGGGCDCEGVSSYTATVLNAAKSLGKGLRELGEQVAAGLTGSGSNGGSASSSKSGSFESNTSDLKQPGLVTIVDIKYPVKDTSPTTGSPVTITGTDPIIAHFIAHSDAIVALEFDPSGMLLLTADKRGHDFHVFRIQPHPAGSHLAAVHHLYVLHRGDTSAKIQDINFSLDSRWVAVSSLRGTTHVFPITPYGGQTGVRTHGSAHVVNRLSRFHRSAGLTADGRSSSPISHTENACNQSCMPYNNPRTPPFPRPIVMHALAQIRQPLVLGTPPGSAQNSYTRSGSGRQRLSSLSDDTGKDMRVCSIFAKPRSWLLEPPNVAREASAQRVQKKSVDSLFVMAGHGALIQYDLSVKLASNIAKDKVCDDTAIELEVEPKAQWYLGRRDNSPDIQPPLPRDNWLMRDPSYPSSDSETNVKDVDDQSDRWLSQVEIITHAGPHRRLWMGPQFVFKTYNTPSGGPLSHIDTEAVEIGLNPIVNRPGRSSPMNMPLSGSSKGGVPVLIESGSYSEFPSSFEQSPKLMDRFRHGHVETDFPFAHGDSRLKEDLADAMRESPSIPQKDTGLTPAIMSTSPQATTATATNLLSGPSSSSSSSLSSTIDAAQHRSNLVPETIKQKPIQTQVLIEKVVNPLGTVTTITRSPSDNEFDSSNSNDFGDDYIIHENTDEALFRPVVAIFCDDTKAGSSVPLDPAFVKPPEIVGSELIVPVIEEKKQASPAIAKSVTQKQPEKPIKVYSKKDIEDQKEEDCSVIAKFNEMSLINRKTAKVSKKSKDKEQSPPLAAKKEHQTEPTTSGKSTKATNKPDKSKKVQEEQPSKLEQSSKAEEREIVNIDENTQNRKNDTLSPKATTNIYHSQNPPKDLQCSSSSAKITEKKPTVIEVAKSVEATAPKKDNPRDAASSFESILIASKKVIEKAEKVLVPNKNTDKAPVKNPSRESPDSKLLAEIRKYSVSEERDIQTETGTAEIMVKAPHSPDLKPKAVNTVKNKKTKDKFAAATLQDSPKSKPIDKGAVVQDVGLQFYEKFSEDDVKTIEIEDFPPLHKVQLKDIEYPSLTASLSDVKSNWKKSKGLSQSPKQSPQKVKKEPPALDKREKPVEIDVAETVTLPLSPKRKAKKACAEESGAGCSTGNQSTKLSPNANKVGSEKKDLSSKDSEVKAYISPPQCSERSVKSKDISSQVSFELISSPDYVETVLPPLENFELPKLEDLYYEAQPVQVSLINFESPVKEEPVQNEIKCAEGERICAKIKKDPPSPRLNYTKDNLILALCGSLHESESVCCMEAETEPAEREVDNIKLNEIEEQYLSLEPVAYQEPTSWTSSSEDTEEGSRNVIKKHSRSRQRVISTNELVRRDDDEELRPLIGGTHSACSMTSSTGAVTPCITVNSKRQALIEGEENSTIAFEIASAISDILPDNNSQSDSSDQGNTLQSAEELDYDMPSTPPGNEDDSNCLTSTKQKASSDSSGGGGTGTGRAPPGGAGSLSSSQQTVRNAKKTARRKKR